MKIFRDLGFIAFCTTACLCSFNVVFSQDTSRRFYSIPDDAGMSNSTALCLYKDSRGFLWIGTQDGMARYDGYRCTEYRWQSEKGLRISYVNQIIEDLEGNLLITSHEGLFLFNPQSETFRELIDSNSDWSQSDFNMITGIVMDSSGNLWMGTYDGLALWHASTQEVERIALEESVSGIISEDWRRVRSLYLHDDHTLWIGTFEGLLVMDILSRSFQNIPPESVGLDVTQWSQIFQISQGIDGTVWLSTQLNGLVAMDGDSLHGLPFNSSKLREHLTNYAVYGSCEDKNGGLWIATDHGLRYCDPAREKMEAFHHDYYDPYSIGDDIITNAPLIDDDILWLPTRYEGVWYTDLRPTFFTPHSAMRAGGLNSTIVSDFAQDGENRLLIATDGGGLNIANLEDWSYEYFKVNDAPYYLPTNKVLSVLVDRKGREWIGTWNEGLVRYDPASGERKLYRPETADDGSISSLSIFYLLEDHSGRIWAATWDNGINLYEEETDSFVRYTHAPGDLDTITESPITHLMEDRKGTLWISSEVAGINSLNPETGEVRYFNLENNESALRSDSLNCSWESSDGLIFIGTNGAGLIVLDPLSGLFVDHELSDSIPAQSVYGIVEDDQKNVWMSTNLGLIRWNPGSNKVNLFTTKDGIHDNRFGRWAFLKLHNSDLLFGGTNGFTQVDSFGSEIAERFPIPFISAVWVGERFIGTGINPKDLPEDAVSIPTVLPANTRSIRFEFTAPWFRGADRLDIQYRLQGIDDNWISIRDVRAAQYHNLKHGDYRFEVRVSNFEGEWNSETAEYEFSIETPFWALWYVQLLFLSLIVGVILFIVFWQIRRYRNREVELEKRIWERTRDLNESNRLLSEKKSEIESQNQQLVQLNHTKDKMLSIFAHDIKNPFNAVLGFSDALFESYDEFSEAERKEYIEYIRLTSHNVYELLENLLFWSISQERKLPFRPEVVSLGKAFRSAFTLYKAIAQQKSISLVVDPIPEDVSVQVDVQLITMVFRNLLNNAIKFSPEGSIIRVRYDYLKGKHVFHVDDQGPGLPASSVAELSRQDSDIVENSHASQKGTGLGLPLCREIILLHEGVIYCNRNSDNGCSIGFELPG